LCNIAAHELAHVAKTLGSRTYLGGECPFTGLVFVFLWFVSLMNVFDCKKKKKDNVSKWLEVVASPTNYLCLVVGLCILAFKFKISIFYYSTT
jgi:glutathione S-transferase